MRYVARILLDATRPRPYPEWCCACEQCLFCMKKVYVRARKAATAWTHREKPMYFFTHKKKNGGRRPESNRGLLHPKQEFYHLTTAPSVEDPKARLLLRPLIYACVSFAKNPKTKRRPQKTPQEYATGAVLFVCFLVPLIGKKMVLPTTTDRQTTQCTKKGRMRACHSASIAPAIFFFFNCLLVPKEWAPDKGLPARRGCPFYARARHRLSFFLCGRTHGARRTNTSQPPKHKEKQQR